MPFIPYAVVGVGGVVAGWLVSSNVSFLERALWIGAGAAGTYYLIKKGGL